MINLFDNTPNDDSGGTCNTNSQIKFKTSVLKSSVCDYNHARIHVERTTTVANMVAAGAAANNGIKR